MSDVGAKSLAGIGVCLEPLVEPLPPLADIGVSIFDAFR